MLHSSRSLEERRATRLLCGVESPWSCMTNRVDQPLLQVRLEKQPGSATAEKRVPQANLHAYSQAPG